MAIRLVMGRDRVTPVVSGIFPPENAPPIREAAAVLARMMEPRLPAIYEKVQRDMLHLSLYGECG